MKDYYRILGVPRSASPEEIKNAYRRLAHKYHPDKGGDAEKFKEINEAYQVLSNKEKRAQYDKYGRIFEDSTVGGGFEQGGFSWSWGFDPEMMRERFGGFEGGDFGEIFEDLFGAFGGSFGRKTRRDPKKGKDIVLDLELTLESVLRDQEKTISLYKWISCTRCGGRGGEPGTKVRECFSCRGTGEVQQIQKTFFGSFTRIVVCPECGGDGLKPEKPCNVCKGEGRVQAEESIKIFIPAGIDSNQEIKVAAKGDAGRRGGKAGNLYVRILIKKHPIFERRGDDLHVMKSISFSQAALGEEIEVPTLDGKSILLKIPEGTESGRIFRVPGKGVPHFAGYSRGNLYVKVLVKTPTGLTKKQRELFEQLQKEGL